MHSDSGLHAHMLFFIPSAGIQMRSDEHFQPRVEYQHRKKPRAGGGDLPYVTNIAMCQHFGQDNMLGATVNVKPAESFEDLTGEYELMKSADFSESA